MGSWTDLDAIYPPGALTAASAFVTALGHLAGARSVYADGTGGVPASFLPRPGPGYDRDLLSRAEHYLRDVPVEAFLEAARALLSPRQRLCLALNLADAAFATGIVRLEQHPRLAGLLTGLEICPDELQPHLRTLALKNELGLFPQ